MQNKLENYCFTRHNIESTRAAHCKKWTIRANRNELLKTIDGTRAKLKIRKKHWEECETHANSLARINCHRLSPTVVKTDHHLTLRYAPTANFMTSFRSIVNCYPCLRIARVFHNSNVCVLALGLQKQQLQRAI